MLSQAGEERVYRVGLAWLNSLAVSRRVTRRHFSGIALQGDTGGREKGFVYFKVRMFH